MATDETSRKVDPGPAGGDHGLDEIDTTPDTSAFVDADREGRGYKMPLAIAVAALVAALGLLLALRALQRYDARSHEAAATKAAEEARFTPDPPARGYESPRLVGELVKEIPEGLGGSPFEGVVVLGVVVSPDGRPTEVTVVRSLHPALDAIARKALEKARFEPARRDGAPVEARILHEIPFQPF